MVVGRSRLDKHQRRLNAPWRQNSSASSSERQWQEGLEWQRVGYGALWKEGSWEAVESYLENCVHAKSGHRGLGARSIFFDTAEKKDHFVASRRRSSESQGKKATKQESWQNEWHHIRNGESSSVPREDLENADAAGNKARFHPGTKKISGSRWKTGDGGVSLSKRRLGIY